MEVKDYLDKTRICLQAARMNLKDMNKLLFLLEKDLEKRKWMKNLWGGHDPDDMLYFTERLVEDYKAELLVLEGKIEYFETVLNEK